MKDRYTPEEVDYAFGGMNSVDEESRCIVAKAIANLPKKIVDWASVKVIFVSSSEEYLAFSLILKYWKHIQGFIFLSEELRKKPEKTKTFTIAHEIAHQKLRHASPILGNLTIEQVDAQEQAADDLALKWLSTEYKTEWEDSLKLRLERKRQVLEANAR
jgi:Zn-dependent peptidase ImmA (M78 family)